MLFWEDFRRAARRCRIHTVCVLQDGRPAGMLEFQPDCRRQLHSVSKSFTCMAVGLAVAEGALSLEEPVWTRLEDKLPPHPDPRLRELTVRHLLTMSSGHDRPPLTLEERSRLAEPDWARRYLAQPLDRAPGKRFTYSSGDTYLLSVLLGRATGATVRDYLVPRLFAPLGIRDVEWAACPLGHTLGCSGLYLSTEELARFGQLLLQDGCWEGRRLIPAGWIAEATSRQIDTSGSPDWSQGYGYQFWRCTHGAVRADGRRGQFCILLREQRAVVAIESEEDDMQGVLDLVWRHVLPQLG